MSEQLLAHYLEAQQELQFLRWLLRDYSHSDICLQCLGPIEINCLGGDNLCERCRVIRASNQLAEQLSHALADSQAETCERLRATITALEHEGSHMAGTLNSLIRERDQYASDNASIITAKLSLERELAYYKGEGIEHSMGGTTTHEQLRDEHIARVEQRVGLEPIAKSGVPHGSYVEQLTDAPRDELEIAQERARATKPVEDFVESTTPTVTAANVGKLVETVLSHEPGRKRYLWWCSECEREVYTDQLQPDCPNCGEMGKLRGRST